MDQGSPAATTPDLTDEEIATLAALSSRLLGADRETRRKVQRAGVTIVPTQFYSTVPTVDDYDASFELAEVAPWNLPRVFKREEMLAFLDRIDAYADEFDPPLQGNAADPAGFFWDNPAFSYSDAMAYYCVLRALKPATVIEIGSGFSTLIARQALDRNGGGGLVIVEPFPYPWLARIEAERHEVPVQSLSPDFFNKRLADGDVLFIDSTHTVKAGSDCLHLYLRVLPQLRADVTVHAHDIYLPFAMPPEHFEQNLFWTEQYLLLAYLIDNPRTTSLFGSRYMRHFAHKALTRFMRDRYAPGGASFWFSRRGRGRRPT